MSRKFIITLLQFANFIAAQQFIPDYDYGTTSPSFQPFLSSSQIQPFYLDPSQRNFPRGNGNSFGQNFHSGQIGQPLNGRFESFQTTLRPEMPPLIFPSSSNLMPPLLPFLPQPNPEFPFNGHHTQFVKRKNAFNVQSAEYSRNGDGLQSSENKHKVDPRQRAFMNAMKKSDVFNQAATASTATPNIKFEEKVLDKILSQLPQIAASVMKIGSSGSGKSIYYTTTTLPIPEFQPAAPKFLKITSAEYKKKTNVDGTAAIINELPKPTSVFSFGKMISSMERQSHEELLNKRRQTENSNESFESDLTKVFNSIRGTPILKSEDEDGKELFLNKGNQQATTRVPSYLPFEITKSTLDSQTPSMLMRLIRPILGIANKNNEQQREVQKMKIGGENVSSEKENQQNLLSSLISGNFEEIIKSATKPNESNEKSTIKRSSKPETEKLNENPNILSSLMNGKFSEVNWINMILGGSNNEKSTLTSRNEEGNALSQLFGGSQSEFSKLGSFFGSGLDDDPSIPNKSTKSNF